MAKPERTRGKNATTHLQGSKMRQHLGQSLNLILTDVESTQAPKFPQGVWKLLQLVVWRDPNGTAQHPRAPSPASCLTPTRPGGEGEPHPDPHCDSRGEHAGGAAGTWAQVPSRPLTSGVTLENRLYLPGAQISHL